MDELKKVLTYPKLSLFLSEIKKIFANKTHTHSKSDVGLGNVDNTADSAKSVKYATSAGSATKLGTATKGSATQPVYLNAGVPTECTYTLGKSVPSNAVFTDTKYTHPSYTAKTSGLYKLTVDSTGHISAATPVAKSDITALGIPAQDTNTTYGVVTTSANGLMSSAMLTKLNGIATGANKYVLPTASLSVLGGVKTTSAVTSTSGLTACPIISGVPYYKDTNTTYNLSNITGTLSLAKGGTGGTTAAAARANLGVIGVKFSATEPSGQSNGDLWIKTTPL